MNNPMRILFSTLLGLMLLAGGMVGESQAKKSAYDKVLERTPKLRDIQIPDVTRVELDNGMIIFLVEDHDLPVVRLGARLRVGSIYEPGAKIGMSDIMGTVMRTGGTEKYPGDELDIMLENMGASVESGVNDASGSVSMRCLSENLDEVMDVFVDILRNPAFPQEKIDLALTQSKTAISRRNDEADGIAWREIFKLYYGDDSPYARQPEYDTLDAIVRGDLVGFHQYFVHPNNIILTVGGDFDTQGMLDKIKAAFEDWSYVDTFFPPDPPVHPTKPTIAYIFKEDVNQSNIRMGHIGIMHDDEHFFPLRILNEILGGGFSSRLFSRVRSQEELAYSVFAWMVAGNHHPGPFIVGCDTKSESTVYAIEIILEEIRKVTEEFVTEDELERAKNSLKNSFVFEFTSPYAIANEKSATEFWGKDSDYLDKYLANVDAVTVEDVLEAAKARIHPDEMAILVVGREGDFDKPLSTLGEVIEIDITIPEATMGDEDIPDPTDSSLAEGRLLLDASLMEAGGRDVMDKLKSFEMKADFLIQGGPMGSMTFKIHQSSEPSRLRIDMSTPFGDMVQVVAGELGWMKNPMGVQSMTPEQVLETLESSVPDNIGIYRAANGHDVQYLGMRELEGVEYDLIYVYEDEGGWSKLYLDRVTHKLAAKESRETTDQGPALVKTFFTDYRKVGGFEIPFSSRSLHNGELFSESTVTELKVNVEFADDLFVEPK
jgi:zinc protease